MPYEKPGNAAAERERVVLHRYMGMLNGKEIGWSVWVECDHVNGDVYEPGSYEHATFQRVEGEGECAPYSERCPVHGVEACPRESYGYTPAPPPASGTEKCKHWYAVGQCGEAASAHVHQNGSMMLEEHEFRG